VNAANLFFHYVSEGPSERRLTISVAALEEVIMAQLARGLRAASLADYVRAAPGTGAFTVSFDDAHRSIREHAAPLLARLGIPATLFVPTAYVGTSPEVLSWAELKELRDAGWTLGSHSETHPRMGWRIYDESTVDYAGRLAGECERSRQVMRRELGEAPALFAYPYGEAPDAARRAVAAAGYAAAFTVSEEPWDGDPMRIPRRDGEPATGPRAADPVSISVVVPAFERGNILSEVVTRLASQTYPEDRYEVIVVDDGSEQDLSPIFAEMPDNVRCVRQGDAAFRAGQARQRGADEARHDVLAFLDADVVVGPDFLWHLDWVHRSAPDAVLLGYLSGYNLHDLGHTHALEHVRGADLESLPIIPDRSREPALRGCFDHPSWLTDPWGLTYTGNVSMPRALLTRVGGFADDFVGWGLEDIDLGYRLHRAGADFVFSRFAVGWHISDPDEAAPRNPFRRSEPTRSDFAPYLSNLSLLEARHGDDPAMRSFVERSRADVRETCARPHTVGIELGGAASVRSPFHAALHHLVPGGVGLHEGLDRVAYANKVSARSVYLLGGAPAEHPAFLALIQAAATQVEWVAMRTVVYPFAAPGLAEAARAAGLVAATCEVHSMLPEVHELIFGAGTYRAFRAGLRRLGESGIERSARLVVSAESLESLPATLEALAQEQIPVHEVVALNAAIAARLATLAGGLGGVSAEVEVLGC